MLDFTAGETEFTFRFSELVQDFPTKYEGGNISSAEARQLGGNPANFIKILQPTDLVGAF